MPLYRPTELQHYLRSLGVTPKKRLSQNFLIDGNAVQKICDFAGVTKGDLVIEIGPGPGALTEALLERGAEVIAIEKDSQLARGLQERLPSLQLLCADVLEVPLDELVGKRSAKVVANIPYHISTPILQKCLPLPCFASCTLTMQEELVRRCLAQPGSPDFGYLSLFVQFYAEGTYGFTISPHSFFPKPKVTSAVVRFDAQRRFPHIDETAFFALLQHAFSQRRKMLKTSCRPFAPLDAIERALRPFGNTCRPEELSLQEWISFYSLLFSP